MYNENISLTPQDILDKDFNVDTRGYRPQEVDQFLDMIIKDIYNEVHSLAVQQYEKDKQEYENSLADSSTESE